MKISEAKDILAKVDLCHMEQMYDRCKGTISCEDCIFHVDALDIMDAEELLFDYYIKRKGANHENRN